MAYKLGYTGQRMVPSSLNHLKIMVIGDKGIGKTSLFMDNPDAFIINADKSETPGDRAPKAMIYPGLREDGFPVVGGTDPEKGQPIVLDWAFLLNTKKQLIESARAGDPSRPKLIVLDTADAMHGMAMDYIEANCKDLMLWSRDRPDPPTFGAIGKAAWGLLKRALYSYVDTLNAAGYGVATLCQSAPVKKYDDGAPIGYEEQNLLPDNTFAVLRPLHSLVVTIKEKKSLTPVVAPNGKKEYPMIRYLTSKDPLCNFKGRTRRSGLPEDIVLDPNNQWESFKEAYAQALEAEGG